MWIKVTKVEASYEESPVYIRSDLVTMFGTEKSVNFVVVGTVYILIVESPAEVLAQLKAGN